MTQEKRTPLRRRLLLAAAAVLLLAGLACGLYVNDYYHADSLALNTIEQRQADHLRA